MRTSQSLILAVVLCVSAWTSTTRAQLPACTGHDAAGASAEFEQGNALLTEAIDHATHRRAERAHAAAAEALAHFDQQCELGDESAYAERGAALMMMGEALRSAQTYDAYLRTHPLDSLDARTRRRVEPNLQAGRLTVEIVNGGATLFVDDLDFGPLPRTGEVRVPVGEHRVEARGADAAVLAFAVVQLTTEQPAGVATLTLPAIAPTPIAVPVHTAPPPRTPPPTPPPARTDYLPFYIAAGAVTLIGVSLGVGFLIAADERARAFNSTCSSNPTAMGCPAVLSERDTDIDVAIAGWIFAGIGIAGLITVIVLDSGQGHASPPVRVSIGPGGLSLSGVF